MKISLRNAGKRFNREWIFRHIDFEFTPGYYAITGPNGSGKSTLLQVIAGAAIISEGAVEYVSDSGYPTLDRTAKSASTHIVSDANNNAASGPDRASRIQHPASSIQNPYKYLSVAAPYLDLIEEMTASEFLQFHSRFKTFTADNKQILASVGLSSASSKQIRYFSSGMKQRLKLAQAFYSDTPVLLLDEPTTNLDAEGMAVYLNLIHTTTSNRLVIVSSNDTEEYAFCETVLNIGKYK